MSTIQKIPSTTPPLKRVLIPKANSKEKRPLGIPTMIERAPSAGRREALYQLGVDPVVETKYDPNSFGFRKNRSTHDAISPEKFTG